MLIVTSVKHLRVANYAVLLFSSQQKTNFLVFVRLTEIKNSSCDQNSDVQLEATTNLFFLFYVNL